MKRIIIKNVIRVETIESLITGSKRLILEGSDDMDIVSEDIIDA